MDTKNLDANTIPTIRDWLQKQGYEIYKSPTNMRLPKHKLLDKVKEHLDYINTPYKFDTLDKVFLVYFSQCIPPNLVILFGNTNRRLRSILNINFMWLQICRRLPRYELLDPIDLQRNQPEGFWKNWYGENTLRKVVEQPSYYAEREIRGSAKIDTVYPSKGSRLMKSMVDVATGLVVTTTYVCVDVVLLSKGKNKGLPKTVQVAPLIETVENLSSLSREIVHKYYNHDVITMTIGESGEIDRFYEIELPESYI